MQPLILRGWFSLERRLAHAEHIHDAGGCADVGGLLLRGPGGWQGCGAPLHLWHQEG